MSPALDPPEPFFEIERVHAVFEGFEEGSDPIGSGRPKGPRNHLWGSIVVLSRSALEGALHRIHRKVCEDITACTYTKAPIGEVVLQRFVAFHGAELASSIPLELHIALRSKPDANAGEGTGAVINGPLQSTEVLQMLRGFNHIRNGFAHLNPDRIEKLPPTGSGVLWVPSDQGNLWSVQKPHAFSVMRFCHTIFRLVVLSFWGPDVARSLRSPLPLLLEERVGRGDYDDPVELAADLTGHLEQRDLAKALADARELPISIFAAHYSRKWPSLAMPLELGTEGDRVPEPVFFDQVTKDQVRPKAADAPSLFDYGPAGEHS